MPVISDALPDTLASQLDQLLPQTQCTKCGFNGCMPYATAIAAGEADINRCPPGGEAVIHQLARLLKTEFKPLDTSRGEHKPLMVALIDEALCIGCTLCIAACPVDAIVGAPKQMHTVINANCSGCDLCIAPCPVDCISMQPSELEWTSQQQQAARQRHLAWPTRLKRAAELARSKREARLDEHEKSLATSPDSAAVQHRRQTVELALQRARARRQVIS